MHRHSLSSIQLVDRIPFLTEQCRNRRILHLGATDDPVTESAIASNRFLHVHLQDSAAYLVGMDLAEDRIKWLREHHGIDNIQPGDIEDPAQYPEGPFDYVIAGEIFEHLNNPGRALDALREVVKTHGKLIITVPNAYSLKGFCRALAGHEWIHPDHVLHHSPSTLRTLLRRHGFRPLQWFSYANGGTGFAASIAQHILKFRPQIAEGIGVIAERFDVKEGAM